MGNVYAEQVCKSSGAGQIRKPGQVVDVLANLNNKVDLLSDRVSSLYNLLNTVLQQTAPKPTPDTTTKGPELVPLASGIQAVSDKISALIDSLEDITNRLEL